MPLNREMLDVIHAVLDTEYSAEDGPKLFRFFTAEDCRHYADAKGVVSVHDLAGAIESAGLVTVGELVAREEAFSEQHSCPRCMFGQSINEVVLAGEHIGLDNLSEEEQRIVAACQQWVTEDTIHALLGHDDL